MIIRGHRFHGYGSLKYVYTRGQTVRGPFFSIRTIRNERRKTYRAAVVVSRKVHKSAVTRNRIRRRIYEVIRQLDDKIGGPYDIVVTVFHATVADLPPKELTRQVKKQLKAAGVLMGSAKKPS